MWNKTAERGGGVKRKYRTDKEKEARGQLFEPELAPEGRKRDPRCDFGPRGSKGVNTLTPIENNLHGPMFGPRGRVEKLRPVFYNISWPPRGEFAPRGEFGPFVHRQG
jgi:hypothetical protein